LLIKLDKILLLSIFLIFSCVDPLTFDSEIPDVYPISISGRITNKPGPYEIKIDQSYDIQSKENLRVPVSANRVIITDDMGTSEQLVEINKGRYQTSPTGIQGRVGGVYKLNVEFGNS
jgi:hypothetical protein